MELLDSLPLDEPRVLVIEYSPLSKMGYWNFAIGEQNPRFQEMNYLDMHIFFQVQIPLLQYIFFLDVPLL